MQSRAPFVFIVLTVALDAMGIGLVLPVMPKLLTSLGVETVSEAALWGGLLAFTYAVMQFLCGPLLGNLSDRYGRRPVLIASLTVMGLANLVIAAAGHMLVVFAARFVNGISAATHATASAYLADISEKGQRAANFGLVGAAFGIGFIAGPALGGFLGEFGARAPFIVAGALSLANALFGFLVVPESLKSENRRAFELGRANPFRALMRAWAMPAIGGLLVVDFIYVIANFVYPAVWAYFTIERFAWSEAMVGASLAAFGALSAVVQGWVIRWLIPRLGERNTAVFGLWMMILSLAILAVIENGVWVFVFMPLTALAIVVGPALQGMMADRVPDDEQGELQGVLSSVAAVGVILSPLLMTGVFRFFTSAAAPLYLPGAPFIVAGLMAVLALVLLARVPRQPHPA